jgi:hypothetical protein
MTDYEKLDANSRVWIFQSDRELSESELQSVNGELTIFVDKWLSHGTLLKAHFELLHKRFIVFFVDEEGDNMCGRAIDASVRFVKELEKEYDLSLLDRSRVAYLKNNNVESCTLDELTQRIEDGEVTQDTIMFNNLVPTKAEFEKSWMIPLSSSWHRAYVLQNQ